MPRTQPPNVALAQLRALQTSADIAALFRTSTQRLDYHLYVRPSLYSEFDIPKKTGGTRRIAAPPKPIVFWQQKLATLLTDAYPRKKGAFGFALGGGIVRGATRHVHARVLLNIDLKDFFDSIHFGRVRGVFMRGPFDLPSAAATILAQVCCYKKCLPQGAPTSPILSNYVCRNLDGVLGRLAHKYRCQYTRYADDITFSTRRAALPEGLLKARIGNEVVLGEELLLALKTNKFEINPKKVWVRTPRERQEVTGLVVNRGVNVRKTFRRDIRAALDGWEKKGFLAAQERFQLDFDGAEWDMESLMPSFLQHLLGKLAFLGQVRGPGDPLFVSYSLQLVRLCVRDGLPFKPVSLRGKAALKSDILTHALWVVTAHHFDDESPLWTGTGFSLDGRGIVTNRHVVTMDPAINEPAGTTESEGIVARVKRRLLALLGADQTPLKPGDLGILEKDITYKVRRAADAAVVYPVTKIMKSDAHFDLAVLQCSAPQYAVFLPGSRNPVGGDEFTLAGFPDWRNPYEKCRIVNGTIAHVRAVSSVQWIEVSERIRRGNSGGPVLDLDGLVIGVATKGEDGHPVPSSAIAVKHLDQVPKA